jgi:hypothetical protein
MTPVLNKIRARVILKTTGATVQLQDICLTVMTSPEKLKNLHCVNSVARKRIVETVID